MSGAGDAVVGCVSSCCEQPVKDRLAKLTEEVQCEEPIIHNFYRFGDIIRGKSVLRAI
ncbi:MAG: hypothetical protein ABFS56_32980 [Pseudomonadota bacterium]